MASKYDGLARIIIQKVDGKMNVVSVTHCSSKVRCKLKAESNEHTQV